MCCPFCLYNVALCATLYLLREEIHGFCTTPQLSTLAQAQLRCYYQRVPAVYTNISLSFMKLTAKPATIYVMASSGMSHVATWWLLGRVVEWRMFPLCLSQCPRWLNPCKNVLLVFLRFLINTWPLLYRDEIGQPGRKNIPVEIQNGVKHNRSLDVLASSHCG